MRFCIVCGEEMMKFFGIFVCGFCGFQFDEEDRKYRKLSKERYNYAGEFDESEWIKLPVGCLLVLEAGEKSL